MLLMMDGADSQDLTFNSFRSALGMMFLACVTCQMLWPEAPARSTSPLSLSSTSDNDEAAQTGMA